MAMELQRRGEIREFDRVLVGKLEVAWSRGNLQMAIDLLHEAFTGSPPEQITIHSPVSAVYDTRLANTLEAMGIYTMFELGQARPEVLLAHPQIGPRMMERIRDGFEQRLGMKRRAVPKVEIPKSETGVK